MSDHKDASSTLEHAGLLTAQARLYELASSGVLQDRNDASLQAIAQLAATSIGADDCLLNIISAETQYTIAAANSEPSQLPLSQSFCRVAVADGEQLVVPSTGVDPRFCEYEAVVAGELQAYAGVPLRGAAGELLGTLCATDGAPRAWTDEEVTLLQAHAAIAELLIQQHQQRRDLQDRLDAAVEQVETIAHDLRSPLAGVAMLVEHVAQHVVPEHGRMLETAHTEARRVLTMLGDLLATGRSVGTRPRPNISVVPLTELLETVFQRVPFDAVVEQVGTSDLVLADRERLEQVVTNLATNAHRYGKPPFSVSVVDTGPTVRVRICDRGPGIAPDGVPLLFRRYAQEGADAVAGSTGLGLSIVRDLMRLQGGDAWYEPNVPHGACFCFWLPAA